MKKHIIYSLLSFLGLCSVVLTGCSKEEIVFDHELPMFETRDGQQLLEVIMPKGTVAGDEIYIVGEFNGGQETAVGDPRWQLEQSSKNDIKWGIYLDPADFVNGKSLSDGYYFYSASQREEVSLRNEPVLHTEVPQIGGRINVTVNRWAAYFDKPLNPDEIVHDGYVIYVVDNSGYDELAMYAWGDAEAFGSWPGITPTGSVNIDGVTYKYFDTGEANKGLGLNLIFNNNNNGSQLNDFAVVLDKDYYLELTPDGVVDFDPSTAIKHDGYAVFVIDNTGYDELAMYMWGDVNDLNGAWPGMPVTGEQVVNGITFKYFDLGEANKGLAQNLIFNNNGKNKQLPDFAFTTDRDIYLELSASAVTEIDPATYTPGDTPAPQPEEYKIYLENNTGWATLNMYAYGTSEIFGGWPGVAATETEVIAGRTFYVVKVMGSGENESLIFHDGNGTQFDGPAIVINRDYYFTVTATEAIEIERPQIERKEIKVYVENATGWNDLYVYAWGESEAFGGWPGKKAEETVTVDGKTYGVITGLSAGEEHLIFNDNNGTQFDGPVITLDRDFYFHVTATEATEVNVPANAARR